MPVITASTNLLERFLQEQKYGLHPQSLYEPVQYIMGLGGKRIRPLLTLLAAQAYEQDLETPALQVATAIEVFHNFSLVHDDIMDEAPLRRGRPSVHMRYGNNTALLAGDVMLIKVYDYLLAAKDKGTELIASFNKVAVEVCEGQQMDMDFEKMDRVSVTDYLRMIEGKTSALLGFAMESAGIIAGAPSEDLNHLKQFGRKLGLAFQIQDDWLDTFGDPLVVGKQPGGDILQKKKTYLICAYMENTHVHEQREMEALFSADLSDQERVDAVISRLRHAKIDLLAMEHVEALTKDALDHLQALPWNASWKSMFESIAKELMQRNS